MEVSLKTKHMIQQYDSAIPFLGIYSKECDSSCCKSTCTSNVIAVLFTIAKPWKLPRCPTVEE
jgi:hypothetical protein